MRATFTLLFTFSAAAVRGTTELANVSTILNARGVGGVHARLFERFSPGFPDPSTIVKHAQN
jgi:hypothetical protein